eukprot:scaffold627_cov123-Isochrysis_galbana.AAC.2
MGAARGKGTLRTATAKEVKGAAGYRLPRPASTPDVGPRNHQSVSSDQIIITPGRRALCVAR